MKGTVLGIVVVLALLAAGAIFYAGNAFAPQPAAPVLQSYANDAYGISFEYPAGYILSENDVAAPRGMRHHVITIVAEADAVPRVNSEGPTAITLDFYTNSTMTLSDWLKSADSNFSLGSGVYASTTVDGIPAVAYTWSGLYEGATTAFIHGDTLIAASVTYISPADQIVSDYETLLASIRFH